MERTRALMPSFSVTFVSDTGKGSQQAAMWTAEPGHWKVSPPLKRTGKKIWESKRHEMSRGRERREMEYDVIWKIANQSIMKYHSPEEAGSQPKRSQTAPGAKV